MYNWYFLFAVLHKPTLLPSTFKRKELKLKCPEFWLDLPCSQAVLGPGSMLSDSKSLRFSLCTSPWMGLRILPGLIILGLVRELGLIRGKGLVRGDNMWVGDIRRGLVTGLGLVRGPGMGLERGPGLVSGPGLGMGLVEWAPEAEPPLADFLRSRLHHFQSGWALKWASFTYNRLKRKIEVTVIFYYVSGYHGHLPLNVPLY